MVPTPWLWMGASIFHGPGDPGVSLRGIKAETGEFILTEAGQTILADEAQPTIPDSYAGLKEDPGGKFILDENGNRIVPDE